MIEVDCEFPGGNIIFDGIEDDTVRVRQDQRDTHKHWWFYWYFRVRGADGRNLRFEFENPVIGVRGPAVSLDGGLTWDWLGTEAGDERSFTYSFPTDSAEVRFSFGMPYTQADLERFLSRYKASHHLRVSTLCVSRKGRSAEALSLGRTNGDPEHRILVTTRHHCGETAASYVLEGLIAAVLADGEDARWLCERVEFLVIPFVDADGVEKGDQGKGRDLRDYNRDYGASSIYPEVQAIRERAGSWVGKGLRFALDLHCPSLRGHWAERIYFVGLPNSERWQCAEAFASELEKVREGPLPYRRANNLLRGVAWNQGPDDPPPGQPPPMLRSCSRWASSLPDVWFGIALEIPHANAEGVEVNAATARSLGRDLAAAIAAHLRAAAVE